MSSVTVGELKNILEHCDDEYEVVMEISTDGTSIAYINGVKKDDFWREVRLLIECSLF